MEYQNITNEEANIIINEHEDQLNEPIQKYKHGNPIFAEGSGEFLGYHSLIRKSDYEIFKEWVSKEFKKTKRNLVGILKSQK